jgi:dienelactone hydrolase
MLKMVRQTDLDIQSLIEYFSTDSRIDPVRVGMVGYSMGGWATFYSAAYNPAIKAAVSIAGTPCSGERWADVLLECSTYPEWDLELEKVEQETLKRTAFIQEIDPYPIIVEKFPVPLLMICGDVDTIAPKKYNLDLYQQILEKHHPDPERLKLSVYDGIGHQLDLNMAEETAAWLKHIFDQ